MGWQAGSMMRSSTRRDLVGEERDGGHHCRLKSARRRPEPPNRQSMMKRAHQRLNSTTVPAQQPSKPGRLPNQELCTVFQPANVDATEKRQTKGSQKSESIKRMVTIMPLKPKAEEKEKVGEGEEALVAVC